MTLPQPSVEINRTDYLSHFQQFIPMAGVPWRTAFGRMPHGCLRPEAARVTVSRPCSALFTPNSARFGVGSADHCGICHLGGGDRLTNS
jgi:hypothetical protein